jgi:hypothetical protein
VGAKLVIHDPEKKKANVPPTFMAVLKDVYLNYTTKNNKAGETLGFNFPEIYDQEN